MKHVIEEVDTAFRSESGAKQLEEDIKALPPIGAVRSAEDRLYTLLGKVQPPVAGELSSSLDMFVPHVDREEASKTVRRVMEQLHALSSDTSKYVRISSGLLRNFIHTLHERVESTVVERNEQWAEAMLKESETNMKQFIDVEAAIKTWKGWLPYHQTLVTYPITLTASDIKAEIAKLGKTQKRATKLMASLEEKG